MDKADRSTGEPRSKSWVLRFGTALFGIAAFLVFSITLEIKVGISFKTTFRIACAIACLFFIAKLGSDYRGERWPRIAFGAALLFNVGLFFSPLAHLPASKGDLLYFGAPDAVIVLAARALSYRVINDHQRAVRQQMVLGLVLALAFCAIVLGMMFIPPRTAH